MLNSSFLAVLRLLERLKLWPSDDGRVTKSVVQLGDIHVRDSFNIINVLYNENLRGI